MTATEWVGVITSAAVFPRVLQTLEAIVRARFAARRSDRPAPMVVNLPSSASSDKLKAVAADIEHASTINKVNEIHEALAGKDPFTKAYVIPVHLEKQTAILGVIKDEAVKQTAVLQRIANSSPPPVPRPDTRYRGGGE